ncbi:hypothetical protein BC826DRAFT_974525 [Russula brevipes]|nr:hypothetical protein BC826DRAFT_974525 [Russula brevipes]
MANWLRKLSCVLPAFIMHHRGDNISRITEPRHQFALWSYKSLIALIMQFELALTSALRCGGRAPQTLPPPSLPYIDPRSCYDEPFDLGTTSPMRPWLRNGLAGTPLAGLSSPEIGRPWAGYYIRGFTRHGPPMFLELRSARPPEDPVPDCLYFRGEGHDVMGTFPLEGTATRRLE